MLIGLMACGTMGEPNVAPIAAEPTLAPRPDVPVKQAQHSTMPAFKTGLCKSEERMRAAFEVKSGKTASVCEHGNQWVYRFGTPENVEVEVERSRFAWSLGHERLGNDQERHVWSVWNEEYRYAVESVRNEDQFDLSVNVHKGAKRVARLEGCRELGVDTTEIPARDEPQPAFMAWVGTWRQDDDHSFVVERKGEGLYLRDAEAAWHGRGDVVHTGEAQGDLVADGLNLALDSEGCSIAFTFKNDDEASLEDNLQCGGMNVRFMGTYRRMP